MRPQAPRGHGLGQRFCSKWLNSIEKLARPWDTERRLVEKPNMTASGAWAWTTSMAARDSEPWIMPPRWDRRLITSPM